MSRKKLLAGLIPALMLLGCGGGGSSSNSSAAAPSAEPTFSLSGVNQMLVAPQGLSVQTTTYAFNTFFKSLIAGFSIREAWAAATTNLAYTIDASGVISPSTLARVVAGKTTDATSDLLIDSPNFLLFRYTGLNKAVTGEQCVLVGVRKSDSEIACISTNPRCDTNPSNICDVSDYRSQIKVDTTGNIFSMVLGDGGLEVVNLTNPAAPAYQSIFTHLAVGDASFPVMNRYADIWTSVNLNSSTNVQYRVYSASGGNPLYTVPSGRSVTCGFAGPASDSANFYYIANLGAAQFSMYKLTRASSGTFTESLVMFDNTAGQGNTLWMNSGGCAQMVDFGDKVYSIGYNQTQMAGHYSNFLYELMNPGIAAGTSTPVSYQLSSDLLYATHLKGYETGLVVAGLDATETSHGIQRFNPGTGQLTTVMPIGSYRIGSMTVAKNGEITFTGIRLSDSANVIVKITAITNVLTAKALNAQPVAIGSVN